MKLLQKILGDPHQRQIKRLQPLVDRINSLEETVKKLSDAKLKTQTAALKERLQKGDTLDDLLPEAFAAAREAARRSIGQRHFDVQLMGGMVLHQGKIAEMRTGEGKTLVATLPVYLNALEGQGVHLVTVNDYLARRDAGWMGKIYHALGLSTGVIIHDQAMLFDPDYSDESHEDERLRHLRPVSRAEAYRADITYGTNNEFGFDYLRDHMADDPARVVQRELHYAIVDEVDSILIDEARTPLIISAPAEESTDKYFRFAKLARSLKPEVDYTVDEKLRAASLTDQGMANVEQTLGVANLYDAAAIEDVHQIEQALKAHALFKLDRDYVVREGEVIIVDEFTGRLMPGRRYSEGLHQAIEAKEGVQVRQESLTLATISFQNYFRLFTKLAGMTGTAVTEAEEFHKIYNLEVVMVPTHRDMIRADHADRIYKTEAGKFRAVAAEVKESHLKGQPVLLGTVSIEKNEQLSAILTEAGVPHEILNAKNNEKEAGVIARAGERGVVTLATNIAGRGTDIVLGEGVASLGGLHVIGTDRHEARRIDNQLRGRTGRQGDPGSSRFYVSLEDDLMRIFGSERIAGLMTTLGIDEDTPIENQVVSKAIESAQKKVEGHNFDMRKSLVEYDDVMNRHREAVYTRRRRALNSQDLRPEIQTMVEGEIRAMVGAHTDARTGTLEIKQLTEAAGGLLALETDWKAQIKQAHADDLAELLIKYARQRYEQKIAEFGDDLMRLVERSIYLRILDNRWIDHLEAMESLRTGIGLRAIGQRDPLTEYKAEAYRLFQTFTAALEGEIANAILKVQVTKQETPPEPAPIETALTKAAKKAGITEESRIKNQELRKADPNSQFLTPNSKKIGRNAPCPCGSGLKYKKCGLINSPEHQAALKQSA